MATHRIPRRTAPLGTRYARFTRSISKAYMNHAPSACDVVTDDPAPADAFTAEAFEYGRTDRLRADEYNNPYTIPDLRQAYDDGWNSVLPGVTTVTLQ